MRWLHGKGMKFNPIWGRQAYLIDGKFKFWGGLTVESKGGGPGLIDQHLKLAEKAGIEIRYGTRAFELIYDGNDRAGRQGEGQRRDRGGASCRRW
jgi:tricarballylate dehydrogenase